MSADVGGSYYLVLSHLHLMQSIRFLVGRRRRLPAKVQSDSLAGLHLDLRLVSLAHTCIECGVRGNTFDSDVAVPGGGGICPTAEMH
jgi:hypothetical protein